MGSRPTITPALMAELTAAAPGRLVRKLDKDPERAEAWSWSEDGCVIDAGTATVTLSPTEGSLSSMEQLACDCLLAPRCLHVLSTVHRLAVADAAPTEAPAEAEPDVPTLELNEDQRAAAAALHRSLVALLHAGAHAAGVVAQGQLLRDAHHCRAAKLPRLAAATLRIQRQIRALHERSPELHTPALTADLASALEVSHRLATDTPLPGDVGQSRRAYTTHGNLRLFGLCCEPVLTTSGYAGVVTWLLDAEGRRYALHDVRPGTAERVQSAYQTGADIGDVALSHQDLCRRGLFLTDATTSASNRLGRGTSVKAVASAATDWAELPFERPLDDQLADVLAHGARAVDARPEGWDLLLLRGVLRGDQLLIGDRVLVHHPATDHTALRYRDNTRILARAEVEVRAVVRLTDHPAGRCHILALQPIGDGLVLHEDLGSLCNLGLDRLTGTGVGSRAHPETTLPDDPAAALVRTLHRTTWGGARALPASAATTAARQAARLHEQMLPTAATLLLSLHRHARSGPEQLAHTFAVAHAYTAALHRFQLLSPHAPSSL